MCYYSISEFFPANFSSTVFGFVNTIARFFTILAPLVIEFIPNPGLVIMVLGVFPAAAAYYLKEQQWFFETVEYEEDKEEKLESEQHEEASHEIDVLGVGSHEMDN